MTARALWTEAIERLRVGYGDDLGEILSGALRAWRVDAPEAHAELLTATRRGLSEFVRGMPELTDELGASDGVSWLDRRFLGHLVERYGAEGAKAANAARRQWAKDGSGGVAPWLSKPYRRVRLLARVIWHTEVEPTLRAAQIVRVPTGVAKSLAEARRYGGRLVGETVFVEPPSGVTLMLPFDLALGARRTRDMVGLRQVLRPHALRTWVATLALYGDARMPADGSFEVPDVAGAILDLRGAPRRRDGRGHHSRDRTRISGDLALFASVRVRVVGDLAALSGDPLLDEISSRRTGKTVCFAHSRLVAGAVLSGHYGGYAQIPRAICRLADDDVPIALGLANVARERALSCLRARSATITVSIDEWLRACGVDVTADIRDHGQRSYWPKMRDRIARVARDARIGDVTSSGAGRDMALSLDVSDELRSAYEPLATAADGYARAKRAARRSARA